MDKKEQMSVERKKEKAVRRTFLKKIVYNTPVFIALGALSRPEKGHADFGGPPSDAGGWN